MTTTNMFLNFGGKWDSPIELVVTVKNMIAKVAAESKIKEREAAYCIVNIRQGKDAGVLL